MFFWPNDHGEGCKYVSSRRHLRNVMSNSLEKTRDRQLESLWRETRIGDFFEPWKDVADEAQRLLGIHKASRNASHEEHEDGEQENGQIADRDATDP